MSPPATDASKLAGGPAPAWAVYPGRPARRAVRLFIFISLAMLMTGLVSMLFADLLWRSGWTHSSTIFLVLFVILFLLISIGCLHGICGFILRTVGDPDQITRLGDYPSQSIDGVSTAIIFPIYNEDVARVFEGCAPRICRWRGRGSWSASTFSF